MMNSFGLDDALVVLGAVLLDAAIGEPPTRVHPVVGMGVLTRGALRLRPKGDAAAFVFGVALVALVVGASVGVAGITLTFIARASEWALPPFDLALRVGGEAVVLSTLFAGRALVSAGKRMRAALQRSLTDARAALSHLCSRDPRDLNREELCGAAIESLSENASDSFVAPLFWYVVTAHLGAPGLLGAAAYRAVNTLDAMVGYRGAYEYLGKAAARLDDILNWFPARITTLSLLLASAVCRLDVAEAWRTSWRDHRLTESPNAGWPMALTAGALRVQLTKRDAYTLGSGFAQPHPATIRHCERLLATTFTLYTLAIVVLGCWTGDTTTTLLQ